ncbi:MAG: peptidoglycan recognition family protein [Candidatus Paceibacterota bacterium]|jgi:N-acetyl-anhydromuramyl-L-alanine amidase AmpD
MNTIQKIWKGSPNFWQGRKGYRPEAIVIHIMDGTLSGTDSWFADQSSQVSSHYGIGKSGEVHQYVKEEDTAWHAGRIESPNWSLIKSFSVNPNLYTIGIEHEGKADDAWSEAMKKSSATLIAEICERWQIPIDRDHVVGHYQIYSKKPNCPATDKKIIDELISLARGESQQSSSEVAEGVKKIEEGLALIKKSL